jgi:ABC-type transport system involved in multi-copper enzyme maturation permease subunit
MPVWILARLTFREAVRRRVLLAALLLACGYLAVFALGLHLQLASWRAHRADPLLRHEVLNAQALMGLYGADLLTAMMAVLTAIDTLSGEIASGTIQAIATKPIERWHIIVGKWMGLAAVTTAFLALVAGGILADLRWVAGFSLPFAGHGLALIWLEGMLLLSTTILGGTLFSTLANAVTVMGLFLVAFIGGWMEQIGAVLHNSTAVLLGIGISLLMPSEALWRRAVFAMESPLDRAFPFSPFSSYSTPSRLMLAYAVVYLVAMLACAIWRFQARDL